MTWKSKAARRAWYKRTKDARKAWLVAWTAANPEKAEENKQKAKQYHATYYQTHKKQMDALNKIYKDNHRAQVNENNRKMAYERAGKPLPPRKSSFYRDVIVPLQKRPKAPEWKFLLSLPLTEKQRQYVLLARKGYSLSDAAKAIGIGQPTITKAWNGSYNYEHNMYHGGIHKKWVAGLSMSKKNRKA